MCLREESVWVREGIQKGGVMQMYRVVQEIRLYLGCECFRFYIFKGSRGREVGVGGYIGREEDEGESQLVLGFQRDREVRVFRVVFAVL